MDTAWIESWLAYTYYNKGVSPNPGPCRNNRLIEWNDETLNWNIRSNLDIATASFKGDYRKVSSETWFAFKKYYPNSGPAITFQYRVVINELDKSKKIEMQNWKIIDNVPPKERRLSVFRSASIQFESTFSTNSTTDGKIQMKTLFNNVKILKEENSEINVDNSNTKIDSPDMNSTETDESKSKV